MNKENKDKRFVEIKVTVNNQTQTLLVDRSLPFNEITDCITEIVKLSKV